MTYPEFDKTRYSVWKLPHWMLVHWVINPGLAFNELVLGQRVPAVTLIERDPSRPLIQRQWIPCPHCGELNHGLLYKNVMLGAHAGLVCASCGEKIPTLKNALTWLVLMATWPVWKPIERRVGPKLLAAQKARLANVDAADAGSKPPSALSMGSMFGFFMGVFYFGTNWLNGGAPAAAALFALISAVIAGVLFGVVMKLVLGWRGSGAGDNKQA